MENLLVNSRENNRREKIDEKLKSIGRKSIDHCHRVVTNVGQWWGKGACRTNWKLIAGINVALFTVGEAILHTWMLRGSHVSRYYWSAMRRCRSCQARHRY